MVLKVRCATSRPLLEGLDRLAAIGAAEAQFLPSFDRCRVSKIEGLLNREFKVVSHASSGEWHR